MRQYFQLQSKSITSSIQLPIEIINIEYIRQLIDKDVFFFDLLCKIDPNIQSKINNNVEFDIPIKEKTKLKISQNITLYSNKFMDFVFNFLYPQDLNKLQKNESYLSTMSNKSIIDDKQERNITNESSVDRLYTLLILYICHTINGLSLEEIKIILQSGKKCCKFCLLKRDIIEFVNWCSNCTECFCK